MRRNRSRSALSSLALCFLAQGVHAQATGTAEGAAFLLLPLGARTSALGQAAAAESGSTESLFWNPAGLAFLTRSEISFHHYDTFFGTGDALAIAFRSATVGTVALGAYVVDYGDLEVTTSTGGSVTVGRLTPRNISLHASYATDLLGRIGAGIAFKLVQFRVDCAGDCASVPVAVGTTNAVDVGLQYRVPLPWPVAVGAVLRNVGPRLQIRNQAQADPLPTRVRAGIAMEVLSSQVGSEQVGVRVLADIQAGVRRGDGGGAVTLLGIESGVGEALHLRAGYAFLESSARGPSIGIGLRVRSLVFDLARLFYAAEAIGDQEPMHVSLRVGF